MKHRGEGGYLRIVPVATPTALCCRHLAITHYRIQVQIRRCLAVAWVTCLVFPDAQQLMECSSQQKESRNSCTSMETYRSEAWHCLPLASALGFKDYAYSVCTYYFGPLKHTHFCFWRGITIILQSYSVGLINSQYSFGILVLNYFFPNWPVFLPRKAVFLKSSCHLIVF